MDSWEWLVLDDSAEPSALLARDDDSRLRYFHQRLGASIGAKRNALIEAARGEVIVHFDDDDYYAPNYIAEMLSYLNRNVDLVKLSGWFTYLCSPEGIWLLGLSG